MKKYTIILIAALSACSSLQNADKTATSASLKTISLKKFKGDTLQYIQKKFIDNKQKYVGKELGVLLKDLEIPVKSYLNSLNFNEPSKTPSTSLEFYSTDQVSKRLDRPDKPIAIIINWSPQLPYDTVSKLRDKTRGEWTADAKQYYSKQIVGDIRTTQYDK